MSDAEERTDWLDPDEENARKEISNVDVEVCDVYWQRMIRILIPPDRPELAHERGGVDESRTRLFMITAASILPCTIAIPPNNGTCIIL
jgi:hypothetical protein